MGKTDAWVLCVRGVTMRMIDLEIKDGVISDLLI